MVWFVTIVQLLKLMSLVRKEEEKTSFPKLTLFMHAGLHFHHPLAEDEGIAVHLGKPELEEIANPGDAAHRKCFAFHFTMQNSETESC